MMPFRTIESMLLPFRIEMPARRLEIRAFALRNLVEVDGVFSRSEIVQVQLQRYSRTLVPNQHAAQVFSLCIFDFDFGFADARGRESEQREKQYQRETSNGFHERPPDVGGHYSESLGGKLSRRRAASMIVDRQRPTPHPRGSSGIAAWEAAAGFHLSRFPS